MRNRIANTKAFALVLVLITLILITTLTVFFLSSVGQERRGVDLYSKSERVRHLAQLAVNRVLAQINLATKEGTASSPVSWAVQPGMIRTYNADGNPGKAYKLYSWSDLIEEGSSFDPKASSESPPSDWNNSPSIFTDLNQPINDSYPILNPKTLGKVQGFSIDASAPAVNGSGLAAPMPVKWLYILEDGRMVAADISGNVVNVAGAGDSNPIVGRIAFWTDDETSKVNVNTSGEGAFWDWPKAATYNEMQFAGNPPMGNEFNRVPGHPGMTSLSATFPELDPGDRWADTASYRTKTKGLLGLTPRIPYDDMSSRGGTYPIEAENFDYGPNTILGTIPSASLPLKTDRLLVSPDELYFQAATVAATRNPTSLLTADMLSQRSFFLTASSRAPETTLFETPRVSVWPITWPYGSSHAKIANRQKAAVSQPNVDGTPISSNTWMRAEERLLAFVSTLNQSRADGGDRYYFQRQNPESPTYDYANIKRNRDLLSYLRRLTSSNIPGYGGSFAQKLTQAGMDGVLANSFNSIRSLVNQYTLDADGKMLYSFTPVSFARYTMADGTSKSSYAESGAFCPIPMKIDLGSGEVETVSEFPSLREAALIFFATSRIEPSKKSGSGLNYNDPLSWDHLINVSGAPGYPQGAQTTSMRAIMLLDFFNLRGSTRNNQPVFWIKIGQANLTANGANLNLGGLVAKLDFRAVGSIGRNMPPHILPFFKKGVDGAIAGPTVKTISTGITDDDRYGMVSAEIPLDPTSLEFSFQGEPVSIEIYGIKDGNPALDPTADPTLRLASYTVDFSSWTGTQKIPIAPRWDYIDKLNSKKTVAGDPKSSECPNPNFNSGASKWAVIEIAPPYISANAASDPGMGGNGSIAAYNSLYPTDSNGSITYPASGAGAYNYSPTYVLRDESGLLMTSYEKRLSYYTDSPFTRSSKAEYSGLALNPSGGSYPENYFAPGAFPLATVYDTVLSVVSDPNGAGHGDPRFAAKGTFRSIKDVIGASVPLKQVLTSEYKNPTKQYHSLGAANNAPGATGYVSPLAYSTLGSTLAPDGMATAGQSVASGSIGKSPGSNPAVFTDSYVVGVMSSRPFNSIPAGASVGDWTSGPGYIKDGGFVLRPEQDFQALYRTTAAASATALTYVTPFFTYNNSGSDGVNTPSSKGYFSPSRQIPSPITLLGSLPSSTNIGWQSLLFSPNPAAGATHPGLSNPPDYLLLDLFWMPIVEPYPISEEFSTAGKINLNYKIMPFGYINRRTGLYALLKSTWLTALSNSLAADYKSHFEVRGQANTQTRYPIDPAETIKLLDSKIFDSGAIFRTAAEICAEPLVPNGRTASNIDSFWNDKVLTSDTAREQPYDHIYSRATTKSNTFTVHWRVQALQKLPSTSPGQWNELADRVTAELRGSTLVERYIDPNATDIPDYATNPSAAPLSHFYKWRVVEENYFKP